MKVKATMQFFATDGEEVETVVIEEELDEEDSDGMLSIVCTVGADIDMEAETVEVTSTAIEIE
jgi:hypothetical protein